MSSFKSERCLFVLQERESAVSEAYSKGVKAGKEQAGTNDKQPSVNVTDEVSQRFQFFMLIGPQLFNCYC